MAKVLSQQTSLSLISSLGRQHFLPHIGGAHIPSTRQVGRASPHVLRCMASARLPPGTARLRADETAFMLKAQYIDAHPHHTIVDRTTGNSKPFTTQESVQVADQSVKKIPDALPWALLWGVSLAALYMSVKSIQGARGSVPRVEGTPWGEGQGPKRGAAQATAAAAATATTAREPSKPGGGASNVGASPQPDRPSSAAAGPTPGSPPGPQSKQGDGKGDARAGGGRTPAGVTAAAAAGISAGAVGATADKGKDKEKDKDKGAIGANRPPPADPAWERYMERQMADVRRQQLVMANEKEAARDPHWWLTLPAVYVIYIQGIGPDESASAERSGLYALNMQADLRDAPARHAIAFADRAEAERCVWLLRSHVAAEAQEQARAGEGDGRLLSVPSVNAMEPKELKEIVDVAGYKATVIRKGEMRIEPHMSKEAIEQQFMEIGGMEYWRLYLKKELKKQEGA